MKIESTSDGLRVLAPAKLNLYLEVGPRRDDGFHDIDSLFQSITLFDELEFHSLPGGELLLEEDGIREGENNIVLRAASLLRECKLPARRRLPGARICLKKRIPEGAGLGGGSSDAAATLLALSSLWGLELERSDLHDLALRLGSDVPFFLVGGTARCQGRGERVSSWRGAFDLAEPFHYVLVYPRIKVSTRLAYEKLDASRGPSFALTAPSPLDSIPAPAVRIGLCRGELFYNSFETVLFSTFPELRRLYALLCEESFLKVLMSGSGSTIFGVCRSAEQARELGEKLNATLEADVFTVSSER